MTATLIFGDRIQEPAVTEDRAAQLAGALDAAGVGDSDAITIFMRNDLPFFEIMLAARRLGVFYAPINWHYRGDEAGYILRDTKAKVLIAHTDLLPQISDDIPEGVLVVAVPTPKEIVTDYGLADEASIVPEGAVAYEDFLASATPWEGPDRSPRAQMAYTSGTTGRPKGVRREVMTPELAERANENLKMGFGIEPGMRTVVVTPLYHSAPGVQALYSTLTGDLVVIESRFEAAGLLALIERHKINHLYLAPIMFVRLLRLDETTRNAHDLSSLGYVLSTGAPVPPDVKRRMIDWWGPVINELYAASEAGLVTVTRSEDWLERPGTVGRTLPHVSVRILDDNGNELPAGEVGSVYIRQSAWPDFTYNNLEEERASIEIDGHVTMGDMGYFDADGYLYISDRKRDMVISGGVNIYPAEIETVLINMPNVQDCAVFGIPDEEYGESLAAVVQPMPDSTLEAESVRSFLRERIAGYKVPRVVEFRQDMPREDTGKIFKRKLRDPYWKEAGRKI